MNLRLNLGKDSPNTARLRKHPHPPKPVIAVSIGIRIGSIVTVGNPRIRCIIVPIAAAKARPVLIAITPLVKKVEPPSANKLPYG